MIFKNLDEAIKYNFPLIKAKLISTEGSVPRNKGTFMLISSKYIFGSIGGGQLEFEIINISKKILKQKKIFIDKIFSIPLGPSIGQCCGGYVQVKLSKFNNGKESFKNEGNLNNNSDNLFIFGAGHIGKELCAKSTNLDLNLHLIDSREEYLKNVKLKNITKIYAKIPWMIVKNLPKNSFFIILTHSHDFDFKIINEILKINNFNFLGLIGSKTKIKRFTIRLLNLGHDRSLIDKIECPIGLKTITGKKPGEIAISIIARLLEYKSKILSNAADDKNYLKSINEQ